MTTKPISRSTRYTTAAHDCEVKNRKRLIKYRAKRAEWLGWCEVSEDEPNSIQRQIFSMIFIDLAYRTLTQPRHTADGNLKIAATNGLLAHLLDQCYVANQVLSIRRLLDKGSDVISVRRLLDDISLNKRLLTREIYVCYDGLPYDPEAWQALPRTAEMHIWGIQAPGLGRYFGARARHEAFDRLSGIPTSQRTRDDLIKDSVFEKLRQWLETSPAEQLITLSHKFFAHAADTGSRGSIEYSGIKLADIAEIHRAIIRVERVITDQLLFIAEARDVVPMPPLGLFQGLDSPYVSAESIAGMYEHWDNLYKERNKWDEGIRDEL